MYFVEELDLYSLKAFRYNLSATTYDRTLPKLDDCYRGQPSLPNGIADISECYYGKSICLLLIMVIYISVSLVV